MATPPTPQPAVTREELHRLIAQIPAELYPSIAGLLHYCVERDQASAPVAPRRDTDVRAVMRGITPLDAPQSTRKGAERRTHAHGSR